MGYKYKTLKDEEKDTVINEFLKAQEMDHFCHSINAERYRGILSDTTLPEGGFKTQIQKLLSETESRLKDIEMIIKHTKI